MKFEFYRRILEKYLITTFHGNPSSGSRLPFGRTDRRTDMTKLIVAFHNFANPPNKILPECHGCHIRCKLDLCSFGMLRSAD